LVTRDFGYFIHLLTYRTVMADRMEVDDMTASQALAEYDQMLDLPKSDWVRYGSARAGELSQRLDVLGAESGIELNEKGDLKTPCSSLEMPIRDFVAILNWKATRFKMHKTGYIPLDV
jgi:hypothetical protein